MSLQQQSVTVTYSEQTTNKTAQQQQEEQKITQDPNKKNLSIRNDFSSSTTIAKNRKQFINKKNLSNKIDFSSTTATTT